MVCFERSILFFLVFFYLFILFCFLFGFFETTRTRKGLVKIREKPLELFPDWFSKDARFHSLFGICKGFQKKLGKRLQSSLCILFLRKKPNVFTIRSCNYYHDERKADSDQWGTHYLSRSNANNESTGNSSLSSGIPLLFSFISFFFNFVFLCLLFYSYPFLLSSPSAERNSIEQERDKSFWRHSNLPRPSYVG